MINGQSMSRRVVEVSCAVTSRNLTEPEQFALNQMNYQIELEQHRRVFSVNVIRPNNQGTYTSHDTKLFQQQPLILTCFNRAQAVFDHEACYNLTKCKGVQIILSDLADP